MIDNARFNNLLLMILETHTLERNSGSIWNMQHEVVKRETI